MAIFSTIATGLGLAKGTVSLVKSVTGKSGTFQNCGEQQQEVATQFQRFFSQGDLNNLADMHTHGKIRGRSANDIAFHFLGGDDCKVTSSAGQSWSNKVLNLLNQRKAEKQNQRKAEKQNLQNTGFQTTSSSGSGGGTTVSNFTPVILISLLGLLIFRR